MLQLSYLITPKKSFRCLEDSGAGKFNIPSLFLNFLYMSIWELFATSAISSVGIGLNRYVGLFYYYNLTSEATLFNLRIGMIIFSL